jgi:DNA-binding transcriptional ArsR family regulator
MGKGRAPSRRHGTSPRRAAPRVAPARSTGGKAPAAEIHRLIDLAQMKVLADPLRIRILELFCEERTTKQVAGILAQPPTRLYHHVAALERVGLIRLARTQQRRGALEKYYLAVAKTFSADARLFSSGASAQVKEATEGVAAQVLENTIGDLRALLERGEGLSAVEQEGLLSYLEVRAGPKELKSIRNKLVQVIKSLTEKGPAGGGASSPYRLTIAFFPLVDGRRPPGSP